MPGLPPIAALTVKKVPRGHSPYTRTFANVGLVNDIADGEKRVETSFSGKGWNVRAVANAIVRMRLVKWSGAMIDAVDLSEPWSTCLCTEHLAAMFAACCVDRRGGDHDNSFDKALVIRTQIEDVEAVGQ